MQRNGEAPFVKPKQREQAIREWRRGAAPAPRYAEKKVGAIVEKLLPKLGLDQQVRQNQLVTDWEKVVGASVARHAKPSSLRDGVLTIAVDHPMWLSELSRYQKPLLLRKVRSHLKSGTVKDIVFRIQAD